MEQLDPTNEASLRPDPAGLLPSVPMARATESQPARAACSGHPAQRRAARAHPGWKRALGIMGDWLFLESVAQPGSCPSDCACRKSGSVSGALLHDTDSVSSRTSGV